MKLIDLLYRTLCKIPWLKPFISPQIIRFILAGMLNTLFSYVVYAMLLYFAGLSAQRALLLSVFIGLIFNYFTFSLLVFFRPGSWRIFGKFLPVYLIVYLFNAMLLEILTGKLYLNPYVAQLICIPLAALFSYLCMSRWVYKKGPEDIGMA